MWNVIAVVCFIGAIVALCVARYARRRMNNAMLRRFLKMSMESMWVKRVDRKGKRRNPYPEGYARVYFHAKQSADEADDVALSCDGQCIVIPRQKEITIPKRFVEVAEHAIYPTFSKHKGKKRKVIDLARKFPFEIRGEGTEDGYLKQIRDHLQEKPSEKGSLVNWLYKYGQLVG